jgi:chromosome segregation ATPase
MKIIKLLLPLIVLAISSPAFSQKYRSAADTIRLNKELVNVSNDIADLTSKLAIAQNNLPGYHTKAGDATSEAQKSADESSQQASKATNGNLGDAKSAKKKAGRALNRAEDARHANDNIKKQDKKIANLSRDLSKKQERLKELQETLVTIRAVQ